MKNNGRSTFSAFCSLLADLAASDENFAVIQTENIKTDELQEALALDKAEKEKLPASSVLLKAAGLALAGKKPWVIGSVAELVGSCYSHIRETAAIHGLPIRIAAFNGGLSSAHEGAAAQMLEDIALMRTIPGMSIYVPSDEISLKGIINENAKADGPMYLRLGSTSSPQISEDEEDIIFRPARILRPGTGITICACGIMVSQAMKAAEQLERQNISAEIIDCCTIKPFPEQTLLSSVRKTGCCVTAEEHGSIGGLYGAAAECLSRTYPVPMRSVSAGDQFISSGTSEELREYYGLTRQEIVDAAAQVWALRRR